jgi:long-subunit acyl-CoA synthetase (AMP-forming)
MKEELQNKLVETYPKILEKAGPIATGDGWYWLIDNLCKQLQNDIKFSRGKFSQIVASQVKEKFGGLRFYINSGSNEQYAVIHFAESLSYSVCEICGSLENVEQTKGSWISSLCKKCRESKGD